MDTIRIRGARTHNLKNIDLDLPRDQRAAAPATARRFVETGPACTLVEASW